MKLLFQFQRLSSRTNIFAGFKSQLTFFSNICFFLIVFIIRCFFCKMFLSILFISLSEGGENKFFVAVGVSG